MVIFSILVAQIAVAFSMITVKMRFNRFVLYTGKSLFEGRWLSMIALYRNKSIQISLHENTSKLIKFIKSPQEMSENS